MIGLGDTACLTRAYDQADLARFGTLCGRSDGDGVPDPLIGALLSCVLGTRLPGPGTGWLKLDLAHHNWARVNEALTARVTVTRLRPDKRLADLACEVTGAEGRAIASGRALMLLSV